VRGRYDVAEVHEPLAWAAALVLRRPAVVVMSHGLEVTHWRALVRHGERAGRLRRAWLWGSLLGPSVLAVRRAAAVMVLNSADQRYVRDELGVAAQRCVQVPNGADPGLLAVVPSTGDGFLFLGSWLPRKGVGELLQALGGLGRLSLTIAGTGDAVGLPGGALRMSSVSREALPDLLGNHSVLVLPSWYEGMPLVALEAAAAGMAVIGSAIPGLVEIFPDGEQHGALLVPPGDADALAEALRALRDDAPRRQRLQLAARHRARGFTWDRCAEAQEQAYEVATRPRTGGGRDRRPRPARLRGHAHLPAGSLARGRDRERPGAVVR
jgi:glycosyltransferase involved in cell wall biosynthesis